MSRIRLAHIVRHPVKSAGYQDIGSTTLTAGRALPFDRQWAIKTTGLPFDGPPAHWMPKLAFVRGAAEGRLQAIKAQFDEESGRIRLTHPDLPPFEGSLPSDGPALVDWIRPLWPARRPDPEALVSRTDGGALTDVPEPHVSILSLKTNRILGQRLGRDLSIYRWRGNLWLDGLDPWEEFDLIGSEITIGGARLRIEDRITRCVATTFDPETGLKDADTLGALEDGFDHQDFGVYARVIESGPIAVGDTVTVMP
ncbi:MAG: MOSC domain-containing protein [Candidatus Eremiobacteraeota bacterium]|nr:MOSC domain-containing protein [Candidatus Eremiobacteraeota bacterium]